MPVPGRRSQQRRAVVLAAVVLASTVGAVVVAIDRWRAGLMASMPRGDAVSLYALLWDRTPVSFTITVSWHKFPTTVAAERLHIDHTIWRQMHFDDWDRVPDPLRTEVLDRVWNRYEGLIHNPSLWDRMGADDWDDVPQPIRAMAFIQMTGYWSGHYQVGASHGIPRGTATDTLAAIMMTESWFEHRASHVGPSGNRDIGLAQASDSTREAMARLHASGTLEFAPADESGYEDPWQATRVLAIWFQRMLDETGGDLGTAIRAYHRGAPLARAGEGDPYLALVVERRRRFIRGDGGSPTWRDFRRRTEQLLARKSPIDESTDASP